MMISCLLAYMILRQKKVSQGGTSVAVSLFYVRCCSIFKCFNFNTSVSPVI